MVRRPQGMIAKTLLALLATSWLSQAQPQASAARQRSGVESPHEDSKDEILRTTTALPQKVGDSLGSARRKSTLSEYDDIIIDASAIATLAPADDAVRAPNARRSNVQGSSLGPQQDARDLSEWEVEDIVLMATVDGTLYCRHRKTGKGLWTLESESPMVEAIYHNRNRSALEDDFLQMDSYLWVVEPSRDGKIYLYIPGGQQGLVNTGLTMKALVEDLSPYSDGSVMYTGEKRTVMFTIDSHNGNVLKWFGAGASFVNDELSCSASNGLLGNEGEECSTRGTFTMGKTEYRVDIHGKDDGHPIATLKYTEWQTNTYDQDLHRQYSATKDGKYVYARQDGSVFAADLLEDQTHRQRLYTHKFSSPVARVYDVVRHWSRDDLNPSLVVLPQPVPPIGENEDAMLERQSSIFLNHTNDGSWYAMSGLTYPAIVTNAPQYAMCNSRDWWQHGPLWEDMNAAQLSKALVGMHKMDTARLDPIRTIDGPKSKDDYLGIDDNSTNVVVREPRPSDLATTIRSLPDSAYRHFLSFISNPVLIIIVGALGIYWWKEIKSYVRKLIKSRLAGSRYVKFVEKEAFSEAISSPPDAATAAQQDTSPVEDVQMNKTVEVKAQDLAILPVEASLDDNKLSDFPDLKPTSSNDADGAVTVAPDEDAGSEDPTKKKKAHRGKRGVRGGVKHKKKRGLDNSASDGQSPKLPTTVEDAVRDAQRLGDQSRAIEPDVKTLPNGVSEVSGPILRLNNLEVDTEKLIGTGSNGTMVFQGKFDGRDVAVKRMLMQFYDIASQETRLLRESDDHENVIRYYAQQVADSFLYIALELCPASLADVIERPHLHRDLQQEGEKDLPNVLYQITKGLQHLHDLRIVHRDLKPQNILVARGKKGPRLLVSDFGLCKKLEGEQSSFRATTAHAAGTSGWRAPELLMDDDIKDGSRITIETSTHTDGSNPLLSTDLVANRRATRAIDIFSLGLVFFYVLTRGSHPYDCGDRYMREVNIRKGTYNLSGLAVLGDYQAEAEDLIASMLDADPRKRPSARDVLAHPFFWSAKKRLAFLCDVSDHFEKEIRDPPSKPLQVLESYGPDLLHEHHNDFLRPLGTAFVDSLGKQRKYTGSRMLDLLRALRNKRNHYEDMPESLKKAVGPLPEGYLGFWTRKFPGLLIACWNAVWEVRWNEEDRFVEYYKPDGGV